MKWFATLSVGLALVASACSETGTESLPTETHTLQTPARSAARQGRIMQKPASASPLSLAVQDLTVLTPEQLAQALVGPGVTISNVSYTGANTAGGTFSGGAAILGFEGGVVLSSGCISNIIGPNTEPGATCDHGLPGDPELGAIAGEDTWDAAVLEFDFVPTGSTVFFRYVFGSEEYNEFVGSQFNDVFAFFINGVNYAVVGDPPVPVTINTINRGQQGGPSPSNPELYRTNDPFDATFDGFLCPPGGCFDTEMDGVTVVLTLEAPVNPGVVNRMKLAIADAADFILDSHVMIQAGTLAICPNPVPLTEVGSSGSPDGTISLSSTTTTVGIYNVEQYLPVGQTPPAAGWVRLGPTSDNGTAAQSFQVGDFDVDGNRDVRTHFSTSQLVADGRISLGTQQITVWGRNLNNNALFCGTRQVTVVP